MSRNLPNLGLRGAFTRGESDWDVAMNSNLLTLSVLTQGRVLSKVSSLPAGPSQGDIYLLNENHGVRPNKIAVFDGGIWNYIDPKVGYLFYNVAEAYYERFTGVAWDSGEYAEAAQLAAQAAAVHASTAQAYADDAEASAVAAEASALTASSKADIADNAKNSAETAADAANEHANIAQTHATAAGASAIAAENSALTASSKADIANNSAGSAQTSANAAALSASEASTSANEAGSSATAAETSALNAASHVDAAEDAADAASSSATAAATSATTASTHATAASNSATAAQTSALTAASHMEAAEGSADAADSSATAAANSATSASTSATNAGNSATAAQNSALTAASHVTSAEDAADLADSRAQAAATSATSASTSATNAGNSATAAQNSALTAASHATTASEAADAAETSAEASSTSAASAATSADAAGSSATSAQNSATAASTSAGNASTSAGAAATSASNAATSAGQASTSETNAAGSAATAATHATNAANSATEAGGSATAASGSASSASTSATNAGNSATAAQSSSVSASSSATDAKRQVINLLPSDFQQDGAYFFSGYQGDPTTLTPLVADASRSFQTVTGVGRVLQILTNGASVDTSTIGAIKVVPGRTYQVSLTHRTLTSTRNIQVYLVGLDASYNYVNLAGNFAVATSNTGWVTTTVKQTGNELIAGGIAYVRAMGRATSTGSGTVQFLNLLIADITESENAASSAAAAATSASNASTSATNAGNSAIAAQNSATSASTSAGNASTSAGAAATSASNAATSAGQASTSETNAAGSAATASTHATNAATSATNANNSATAAGTSATTAGTHATNAGNSATAANTSSLNAASSFTSTNIARAMLFPDRYDGTGQYFTASATGSPSSVTNLPSNATVSGYGEVYEITLPASSGSLMATRGVAPAIAGRTYKLEVEIQRTAFTGTSATAFLSLRSMDSSFASLSATGPSALTLDGTVQKLSTTFTATGGGGLYNWHSSAAWLRPGVQINTVAASTVTCQIRRISFTDITLSEAAASSASAANTSAGIASTHASNAGTSATAAQNSALLASAKSNARGLTVNADYIDGIIGWFNNYGVDASYSTPTGMVAATNWNGAAHVLLNSANIRQNVRGSVAAYSPSRKYRVKGRFRCSVVMSMSFGYSRMDSSGVYQGVISVYNTATAGANTWHEFDVLINDTDVAGAAQIAPWSATNITAVAGAVAIDYLFIEDVTESWNAEAQAGIATNQATLADGHRAAAETQASLSATYSSGIATSLSDAFPKMLNPELFSSSAAAGTTASTIPLSTNVPSWIAPDKSYIEVPDGAFSLSFRGTIPVTNGDVFRLTADIEQLVSAGSVTSTHWYIRVLDADFNLLSSLTATGGYVNRSTGQRSTQSYKIGYNAPGLCDYNVTTGSAKYFRIVLLVNRLESSVTNQAGSVTRVHAMYLEDIRSEANALAQAGIATSQATLADGYRASAATEATLSSTYASDAKKEVIAQLPSSFEKDGTYFRNGYDGSPDSAPAFSIGSLGGSFLTITGVGRVIQVTSTSATRDVAPIGAYPVFPGRKYRISTRCRTLANTRTISLYSIGLDDNYAYAGGRTGALTHTATTTWQTFTYDVDPSALNWFANGLVYIRPLWRGNAGTETLQLLYIKIEDITNEKAAEAQAAIATTQATNASNSAAAASTSQTLSARYANQAIINDGNWGFENGLEGWSILPTGYQDATTVTIGNPHGAFWESAFDSSTVLRAAPSAGALSFFSKKTIPINPDRKYRIRGRFGAYNSATPAATATIFAGFIGLDASYNVVNHGGFGSYRYSLLQGQSFPHSGSFPIYEAIVTGSGNDSWLKFPPGTTQVRLMMIMNYNSSTLNTYCDFLTLEDVTETEAAAASATIASNQAVIATNNAAAASTSALLSASLGKGYLNSNANFASWGGSEGFITAYPTGWIDWSGGASIHRKISMASMGLTGQKPEGSDWVYSPVVTNAGANSGLMCSPDLLRVAPGRYTLDVTAQLMDGNLDGSGVLVYLFDASNNVQSSVTIRFWADPDMQGVTGSNFNIRRWSKSFTTLSNTTAIRIYAMANWSGFPSPSTATKTLAFFNCGVKAGDATDATVATHASTIATLETRTASYITKVSAGSGTAELALSATDSGGAAASNITLKADKIKLGSVTTPALEISGGNVVFTGQLNVGGASGARVNITNNLIRVYDASNVLRVRMGIW